MKYRIKSKQYSAISSNFNSPVIYVVQAKCSWFPFFFSVTRWFYDLSEAEEHIELLLDEKGN